MSFLTKSFTQQVKFTILQQIAVIDDHHPFAQLLNIGKVMGFSMSELTAPLYTESITSYQENRLKKAIAAWVNAVNVIASVIVIPEISD